MFVRRILLLVGLSALAVKARFLLYRACRPEDGYHRCPNSNVCIYRHQVHDTFATCRDKSDETQAMLDCTDDEFRCRVTSRCIPRYLVNSADSCTRNEGIILPCRPSEEFTCTKSLKCIPRWMVQDGSDDCNTDVVQDNSDETATISCFATEVQCVQLGLRTLPSCIPRDWIEDGSIDCKDDFDELNSLERCYNDTEFRCLNNGRCIPRYRVMDGFKDCRDGSDEQHSLQCNVNEFRCHDNTRCIPRSWRGNTLANCADGSDELPMLVNETCLNSEFRCHNDKRCLPKSLLCDGMDHCGDCSDEIESCAEPRLLRCPGHPEVCVQATYSCDAYTDCPNHGEDVQDRVGFKCLRQVFGVEQARSCLVPQWSLNDSYSLCDDESDLCYTNGTFRCSKCLDDKTIIAPNQRCDGVIDCPDLTDECLCSQSLASHGTAKTVCDSVCYGDHSNGACSYCKPGEIWCGSGGFCVPMSKVCDGVVDCPLNGLDELACGKSTTEVTAEKSADFPCDPPQHGFEQLVDVFRIGELTNITAPKFAVRCDGIPECMIFEDECSARANCSNIPDICYNIRLHNAIFPKEMGLNETLRFKLRKCSGALSYVFGASICNGIQECSFMEDEIDCPERFYCDVGQIQWLSGIRHIVSIPMNQRCDAKMPTDCIDQKDEKNCSSIKHFYCEGGSPLFVPRGAVLDGKRDCKDLSDECPTGFTDPNALSSREEMIRANGLSILVWFMAVLAIVGNAGVITVTLRQLIAKPKVSVTQRRSNIARINKMLILNLAMCDILMGIALLTIGAKSAQFSGGYCLEDQRWRTSSTCDFIGIITVLSSEASVFTLVCLTSYRLFSIYFPMASRGSKVRYLLLWILCIWTLAVTIALLPLAKSLSSHMVTGMLITPNPYFGSDVITLEKLQTFAERLSLQGSNTTQVLPDNWYDLYDFLRARYPESSPLSLGYFGYYSSSSVCIPKFYRIADDKTQFNIMSFVVITFNFVSLIYVASAYVAIYHRSVAGQPAQSTNHRRPQRSTAMQRKIALLVATDFCCWLPICVMTFLSMANISLPPEAYAFSAIILLPINSCLNPLIYSNVGPTLWKFARKHTKNRFCSSK